MTSVFFSSSRLTRTSGIEPPVKPTTTRRPSSRSERRLSVKRSPPTGSSTIVHAAAGELEHLVLPALAEQQRLIGAGRFGDLPLGLARDQRDRLRAEALGDLQARGPDAAGGAVHQHGLALCQAPAQQQREVRGVIVEDQRRALGEVELGREREREELGRDGRLGKAAERAERGHTVARLPRPRPRGRCSTMPPTSLPGTNGSGGFIWYSPRVCSSSGKLHASGVHLDHAPPSPA